MSIPTYEFILWDNCNNNCDFCFQNKKRINLPLDQKRDSIKKVIEFIDSDKFESGSHIMIVGGEIFDQPILFDSMKVLIDFVIDKMKSKDIDILYANTNLLYKDLKIVSYLCEKIDENKLSEKLHLTSSYDVEGRFKNEKCRLLMLSNMKYIVDHFKCDMMVNSILTKQLCEQILSGEFDLEEFSKRCTYVNFLPYIVLDGSLTPERNILFQTLLKINEVFPYYMNPYVLRLDVNQDKRVYAYVNGEYVYRSADNCECGHSENFKRYSSNNSCYVCDLKRMFGYV